MCFHCYHEIEGTKRVVPFPKTIKEKHCKRKTSCYVQRTKYGRVYLYKVCHAEECCKCGKKRISIPEFNTIALHDPSEFEERVVHNKIPKIEDKPLDDFLKPNFEDYVLSKISKIKNVDSSTVRKLKSIKKKVADLFGKSCYIMVDAKGILFFWSDYREACFYGFHIGYYGGVEYRRIDPDDIVIGDCL